MKFDITKIDINDIRIIKGIAAAFLLIVLIVDVAIFSPIISAIGQVKAKNEQEITALKYFNSLMPQKGKFSRVQIIPQENMDALLDRVQKLAENNNLGIKIGASVGRDKDDGNSSYAREVFTLDTDGSFKNMGVFLTALRNMHDAVLDIESMHLASDRNSVSNVQARIKFVVLTTKDE